MSFHFLRTPLCTILCTVALCWIPPARAQYDLLLRGGHVIDPRNGIDAPRDVAIQDGKIAAVEERIDPAQARRTFDVSGLYVTPGLVDLHVHVYYSTGNPVSWAGDESVQPDAYSFRAGVTTMVDAGSSGWRNFEDFRARVITRAVTRVLALINIAGLGMITDRTEQDDFDSDEVARLAKQYPDIVVGVKSAHYQKPDWKSVDEAVEAGKKANIPIMVDFGYFLPERPFWQLVTERLRPGDMPTHCFRGPVPWVDAEGKLYDYLHRARARGVKFDVGHGGGSFVFRNAVPAIQQGFYPDSISTDLHAGSSNAGMMDMPTTMSKFLAMGMPLVKVIEAATWNPAQQIHRPELGHLSVGALADVAVLRLQEGEVGFRDARDGFLKGSQRLTCELTLKDGEVRWDWNSLSGTDYRQLEPTYGARPGLDHIIPPPR